ncbi:lysosome-associated membrane glycoprotein 1-like isoform X2 [Thunnus thynnus]|uniref:lysosome-associated membrane glycoprotein 1-like isoform X2 n=1 Tax=Thunnus thynnus TaxID=8237 RepID=UPI003527C340
MNKAVVFIFMACCAVSALSLAENEKRSKPSATMSAPGEFVNSPPASTPGATTTQTNTSTPPPKPTPTTAKSTTTTAKSTTTTAKPTPTTAKSTTTTPKPTTTPTPSSPPPTPPANLTEGKYNLTKDKKVCLMAQMAVQIRLATPKANGTFIVQPALTKADGSCGEKKANLTLVFKEGHITFMFNKSASENTAYVDELSFTLSYPLSKDLKEYNAKNSSVHLFAAKVGRSYSCRAESIYMGNGLYLDVNQDRMQAFNLTNNDFGNPDHCAADRPDYRVAIAVGVTLLVLIVIVVVAYLLGRRKRADGYQSL